MLAPGTGLCEVCVPESVAEIPSASECQAAEVAIPEFPVLQRKCVQFNLAATIIHEVIPYAEIYGAHPRTFVFDKDS